MEKELAPKTTTTVATTTVRTGVAIRRGDVLLKYSDGSTTNLVIAGGQSAFSSSSAKSDLVHAAIAVDSERVIESEGGGLESNSLRYQNKNYKYVVFRCLIKGLPDKAAEVAAEAFSNHDASKGTKHKYDILGAACSLFKSKSTLLTPLLNCENTAALFAGEHGVRFFCSGFVVAVYLAAAQKMPIPLYSVDGMDYSPEAMEPSFLYESLNRSGKWERVGLNQKAGSHS